MVGEASFERVNARHVRRADGIEVEFVNAHEVEVRRPGRAVRLQAERHIADDGAPDGRDVVVNAQTAWLDGIPLTAEERDILVALLQQAAPALRTKFRIVPA